MNFTSGKKHLLHTRIYDSLEIGNKPLQSISSLWFPFLLFLIDSSDITSFLAETACSFRTSGQIQSVQTSTFIPVGCVRCRLSELVCRRLAHAITSHPEGTSKILREGTLIFLKMHTARNHTALRNAQGETLRNCQFTELDFRTGNLRIVQFANEIAIQLHRRVIIVRRLVFKQRLQLVMKFIF